MDCFEVPGDKSDRTKRRFRRNSRSRTHAGRPVRCYHRGCKQWLRPPAQGFAGDICPEHLIRCHGSSGAATYCYAEVRRNIIVGADLLAERIIGHLFNYESDRLRLEKSEDALTWNVLRSLHEEGCSGKWRHGSQGSRSRKNPLAEHGVRGMDGSGRWNRNPGLPRELHPSRPRTRKLRRVPGIDPSGLR
jgi:hypothetical protein